MPKYLIQASYTAKGITGLLKEGGSSRKSTVEQTISGLGGKVEAYHYAFGEWDVFVIAEMPDEATAAAVVLAFGASGAVHIIGRFSCFIGSSLRDYSRSRYSM